MLCLDSNVIIDFIKGDKNTQNKIKECAKDYTLITTSLNVYEILKNVKKKEEKLDILDFVNTLRVISIFKECGITAAEIYQALTQKGQQINDPDILIGSTIKSHGCTNILTNNKKDFERIEGLQVIEIPKD